MKKQVLVFGALILAIMLISLVLVDSSSYPDKQCKVMQKRLDGKIKSYERFTETSLKKFLIHENKINESIKILEKNNHNVTNLRSNLSLLNNQLDKFVLDNKIFINIMKEIKDLNCDVTGEEVNPLLDRLNSNLEIVLEDINNFKITADFIDNLIRIEKRVKVSKKK